MLRTYGAGIRPLNAVNFDSKSHRLECRTYSLESFLHLEAQNHPNGAGSLEQLFDYWSQQDGSIPTNFRPFDDVPAAAASIRAIIDVQKSDPMDFVLADHQVCTSTGRAAGWRGKPLGKIESWTDYLRIRAMQYNLCRRTGIPSFHEIKHDIGGLNSHFVVLLLPASEENNGNTINIYSCVRRLSENKRMELSK